MIEENVKRDLALDSVKWHRQEQGRLCYDCNHFDQETLKCPKRLGKFNKPTYVYTPTKAQNCKKFRKKEDETK